MSRVYRFASLIGHLLVHLANWSPRLQAVRAMAFQLQHSTHLTTRVPGMGTASTHFPLALRTCKALTSSCCQRIVKH